MKPKLEQHRCLAMPYRVLYLFPHSETQRDWDRAVVRCGRGPIRVKEIPQYLLKERNPTTVHCLAVITVGH